MERAEILVDGVVQGVSFRYFVLQRARELDVKGWTENLSDGRVRTVAEGTRRALERLYELVQEGPLRARVEQHSIQWLPATGEFDSFEIRR